MIPLLVIAGSALFASDADGSTYAGGEALVDLARVGEAQHWPAELLDGLLEDLPGLEAWDDAELSPPLLSRQRWDGNDEPGAAWFLAAADLLEERAGNLPGGAELASAWRQRATAAHVPRPIDNAAAFAEGVADDTVDGLGAARDLGAAVAGSATQAAKTSGQALSATARFYAWVGANPGKALAGAVAVAGLLAVGANAISKVKP